MLMYTQEGQLLKAAEKFEAERLEAARMTSQSTRSTGGHRASPSAVWCRDSGFREGCISGPKGLANISPNSSVKSLKGGIGPLLRSKIEFEIADDQPTDVSSLVILGGIFLHSDLFSVVCVCRPCRAEAEDGS